MGVKIADKLEQFNNGSYYLVDSSAVEYVDKDGVTKSVKEVLDSTPTDVSTHKTTIYENHIDMGKYMLLAKITGANYTNNIIKFSCPNHKGSMDVGFRYEDDMDIYKFELHFNTGSRKENNGYGVTLKQHGLGLYSYPLSNPKNTEPKIEEAIRLYWDYSKGEIYVFLVDIMTAIPHCVLEYTGSGTLLRDNTFVMDDLYNRREGLNGTWEESKWKSIPYNKLEVPPIHELGGEGSSAEGITTYTSIEDLGLTAPVTVGEIFNAMPDGTMAVIACEEIEENTQGDVIYVSDVPTAFGILTIKKNAAGRFSIEYQNSLQGTVCNVRRWIGTLKGLDGTGLVWKQLSTHSTYTDLSELGLDSTATLKDITKTMANNSMIAIKVDAMADQSEYNDIVQGTVTIYKVEDARIQAIMTDKATGRTWIGIIGGANTIIGWKRVVTETEITNELTNTSTINQIPNASIVGGEIHGKFIDMAVYSDALKMPIGKWRVDSNAKASQMQNLPVSKAGILEINYLQGSDGQTAYTATFKYAMLTYTVIDGNIYKRSFNSDNTVGNIVNDTGWEKIGVNDTRVTTLETQVNELFQSVSSGKSLVANAITGKGVSTATNATFATMATNIGKIGGSKEETKSFPVPLTGSTNITSTFSADVIGVKQIILPTNTSRLIPQETGELFKIEGKKVTMTLSGVGTWKVTALIQA